MNVLKSKTTFLNKDMSLVKKNGRNSNVELLRIIAMIVIIIHHYMYHGLLKTEFYNINYYIANILSIGGALGVDIFFIISGYYIYKSKITARKILRIEGQVLFYSISIFIILSMIFKTQINIQNCIYYFGPISKNLYWFATAYMLIMIFSKYINKLADSLEKMEFKILIFTLLIIYFTLPTYLNIRVPAVFIERSVTLYLIGAYIRKYNISNKENKAKYKKKLLLYFTLNTVIIIATIYIHHISKHYVLGNETFSVQQENPIIVLIAIYMFLLAISAKEIKSKVINTISSTTFGVYLIHDNPIIRLFLWEIIVGCTQYSDKPYMIVSCIGTTLLIFVACSIIDLIRICTIEKIYMKVVDKVIEKIKKLKQKKLLRIELR